MEKSVFTHTLEESGSFLSPFCHCSLAFPGSCMERVEEGKGNIQRYQSPFPIISLPLWTLGSKYTMDGVNYGDIFSDQSQH